MMERKTKNICERGAIMLEVIAVLSLMGLMGSMLFRQIYKRNQELHNIQMASEIRIVKEAFSAYLQANPSAITCPGGLPDNGDVVPCQVGGVQESIGIGQEVKGYLPDGFFPDEHSVGDTLNSFYGFKLYGYLRGTNGGIPTYYGVVIPRSTVLPELEDDSSWNTRRAARIAMLVGVDGGLFDPNLEGQDGAADNEQEIHGSVGTWHLFNCDNNGNNCIVDYHKLGFGNEHPPIYVAMTELDVYQPEVDLPEQKINLRSDWDLALRNLHAYGLFTVGGKKGSSCYTVNHTATAADGMVANDNVNSPENCLPAFWVQADGDANGETGHVFVLNDLHVGSNPNDGAQGKDSAITLGKTGEVILPNLVITESGRIVSSDVTPETSNLAGGTHYELDPAYTSVMNDIRLTSRGGARLSDILPDYILKKVEHVAEHAFTQDDEPTTASHPHYKVNEITCPTGYRQAIVINPRIVNVGTVSLVSSGDLNDIYVGNTNVEIELGDEGTEISGGTISAGSGGSSSASDSAVKSSAKRAGDDDDDPENPPAGQGEGQGEGQEEGQGGAQGWTPPVTPAVATDGLVSSITVDSNTIKYKTRTINIRNNPVTLKKTDRDALGAKLKTNNITWTIHTCKANGAGTDCENVASDEAYREGDGSIFVWAETDSADGLMAATVEQYCVFNKWDGHDGVRTSISKDNGGTWEEDKNLLDRLTSKTLAEAECKAAGFTWSGGACTSAVDTNTAAGCRLAGRKWTGTSCEAAAAGGGE